MNRIASAWRVVDRKLSVMSVWGLLAVGALLGVLPGALIAIANLVVLILK